MTKNPPFPLASKNPIAGAAASSPTPAPPAASSSSSGERQRITVDVSPSVASLLDHYCETTGQARSAVILGLLTAQLPAMLDLADNLKKRAGQLPSIKR